MAHPDFRRSWPFMPKRTPDHRQRERNLATAGARALLPDPTIPIEVRSQQSITAEVLAWARFAPERVAVSVGGRDWTYAELSARATLLSTTLREMGIGRGDVVAIIGPRSFGLIGTMLGVLMSWRCVPYDRSYAAGTAQEGHAARGPSEGTMPDRTAGQRRSAPWGRRNASSAPS